MDGGGAICLLGLLFLAVAVVAVVALVGLVLLLVKLGVIARYATKPEPPDESGHYTLDQTKEG